MIATTGEKRVIQAIHFSLPAKHLRGGHKKQAGQGELYKSNLFFQTW